MFHACVAWRRRRCTLADVLRVRLRTTGIVENVLDLPAIVRAPGGLGVGGPAEGGRMQRVVLRDCTFIDVGGQRPERKKWSVSACLSAPRS